jgi:AcrR family transcriptional regulator
MREAAQIPLKQKKRLYPAVLDLFSKNDFHQVNMRTVSRVSGVSIGTIYRYFSSKEDLLFSILKDNLAELVELMYRDVAGLENFRDIFHRLLLVTMEFYDARPSLAITAFITVPTRTWMQDEGFRIDDTIMVEVLEKARDRNEVDPRIDVRRLQDIYFMICYRCIHTWYYFGQKWRLVEAVDDNFEIYWKMLAPHIQPT